MGKAKATNAVLGRWSIDSMSMWDKDYIDVGTPGYFDFGGNNLGSFKFGYVQGDLDYRLTQRDGKPAVEFSFEGGDAADCSPCSGRGWLTMASPRLNCAVIWKRQRSHRSGSGSDGTCSIGATS